MNYKALIIDFDGTLSKANFQISEPVMEAVKSLVNKKIPVVIATGRSYQWVMRTTCSKKSANCEWWLPHYFSTRRSVSLARVCCPR